MEHLKRYLGLYGSARSWLIGELQRESADSALCLVLVKNRKAAEDLQADLEFFVGSLPIIQLTGWETIPFEAVSPQLDICAQRLAALDHLRRGEPGIVIATADALAQKVLPPWYLEQLTLKLNVGDRLSCSALAAHLDLCGYQRVSLCEDVGEATVHGAVIDLFPALAPAPYRIFFDGERINEIKLYDADTQRTSASRNELVILPVSEAVPFAKAQAFQPRLAELLERLKERAQVLETPTREINDCLASISSGTNFPGIEWLMPFGVEQMACIFDYVQPQCQVIVEDQLGINQALDTFLENVHAREQRLEDEHFLIPEARSLYLSAIEIQERLAEWPLRLIDSLSLLDEEDQEHGERITIRSTGNTELVTRLKTKIGSGSALQPLARFLSQARRADNKIAFCVGSQPRAERLYKLLLEINIEARILDLSARAWQHAPRPYPVVILQGQLTSGFQLPDLGLVFISESEIFIERSQRKGQKGKLSLKRLMGSLAQLAEGDFVVHVDYGVGLYHGLKHLEIESGESDFLHIEYADSVLYLPVQNIGKVQKFSAADGQRPVLDKLGSTRWVKTKQKVKESVATLAGDLIRLYATRSVSKGWRFEPFGAEDERFAEDFPYNETADQLSAIQEALKDMAAEKPMDRLVCGDVGFGKTEVALRAAFKCSQHTRQTALLVPTTILAEQHFQNFQSRLSGYPLKIAVVSRFQPPAKNRETLKSLANGELDVIIGTHRLLSRDVVFKDLGLLIIDEEHRFGVKQKERLKALKKNVDVLTLTATPIPRTLHMSLLGIRDISVISTPPTDRKVIRTYVAGWDEQLVRDAILRELQRGGQCFFVHNRIQSIDLVTAQLQSIVPEARFCFAHGQMSERQLEPIMQRFVKREIDVLVSTSIIESGIDIPNANTMIVDRADMYGLAQLYQLRGRVGRSPRQAYCYFLVPKTRKLSVDAQKRLKALQALDDLGLGFNLALRDMEIRGAGNLLGKEQSGNVLAVGFELYNRILKEAILNLKGEQVELRETIDPDIKLGLHAFIPEQYIPDVSERLVLYQRLAAIENDGEAELLSEEVSDRYGPMERETRDLIDLMRLRAVLRDFGVVRAELKHSSLALAFSPQAKIDIAKLMQLTKAKPEHYRFSKNLTLSVKLEAPDEFQHPAQYLSLCRDVLLQVAAE